MSFRTTTALVTLGLMVATTPVFAGAHAMAQKYEAAIIDKLPDEGGVTVFGSVGDLDGKNEFSLVDAKGESIRVESDRDLNLRKGDRVKVISLIDKGFLRIGSEIDAVNITVLERATASVETDSDVIYRTTVHYFFDDDTDWKGEEYGAIDKLPEAGGVAFSGTVKAAYPNEQVVIVSDSTGDTIDVHTIKRLSVKQGDKVVVQGWMADEFAGIGREIVSARVTAADG